MDSVEQARASTRRERTLLGLRCFGSLAFFVGATYCLITLRDPFPALSRALDDRHAYFATTLLVLAPILLVWHIAILYATIKRTYAAIPPAALVRVERGAADGQRLERTRSLEGVGSPALAIEERFQHGVAPWQERSD